MKDHHTGMKRIDRLQLTENPPSATTAHWNQGDAIVTAQPISDEEAAKRFQHDKAIKPYPIAIKF